MHTLKQTGANNHEDVVAQTSALNKYLETVHNEAHVTLSSLCVL